MRDMIELAIERESELLDEVLEFPEIPELPSLQRAVIEAGFIRRRANSRPRRICAKRLATPVVRRRTDTRTDRTNRGRSLYGSFTNRVSA